jgi:hypothetical protein
MNEVVRIEGMSDCLNWCDKAPEDMVKLAKKAMRAGGGAVTKRMKPSIDARWRRLIKYKVTGGRNDKDLNCGIGFFNGHQQQGKQSTKGAPIDDWFKFYWMNYGTLTRRDPNHRFTKPIRPAHHAASQRRRNRLGQPHRNYFEAAMEGYEDTFFNAFAKHVAENIEECYDR